MSDKSIWTGFLEAGDKSALVVRDRRLDTGNPKTIYLYNHRRGVFLEYASAIVESKLRTLTADEQKQSAELLKAFRRCREQFTPRGDRLLALAQQSAQAPRRVQPPADNADDAAPFLDDADEVDWDEESTDDD